jgi:6-phosphogluconate dehydrogenase (decarboxylating)
MVHNGIEYGVMAAFAEGFGILRDANLDLTAISLVKDQAPVLSAARYRRFTSRGEADYQDKLLSAMRYGFGGHLEKSAGSK